MIKGKTRRDGRKATKNTENYEGFNRLLGYNQNVDKNSEVKMGFSFKNHFANTLLKFRKAAWNAMSRYFFIRILVTKQSSGVVIFVIDYSNLYHENKT